MWYGTQGWDPVLIIAQIISMQCIFYITLGALQALMIGPSLDTLTVAFMFDWRTLSFQSRVNALTVLSHGINSILAAAALVFVVERAKKCLDFAATCYIWHFIFCCASAGLPRGPTWWATNGGGFLAMALLGEYLCVRREMQDIPVGLGARSRKDSAPVGPGARQLLPTSDPDLPPRPGPGGAPRMRAATPQQRISASSGIQLTTPTPLSRDSLTGGSASSRRNISRAPSAGNITIKVEDSTG